MGFAAPIVPAIGTALGSALGGTAGGGPAPAQSGAPVAISFGSKTLGTGAKGGDTTATGGDGASLSTAGGAAGAMPAWLPLALAGVGVVLVVGVLFVVFPRRKKKPKA